MQHFKSNPDYNNPAYNTKLGIYSEGCGLDNVMMSWGHDDYMYLVCLSSTQKHVIWFQNLFILHVTVSWIGPKSNLAATMFLQVAKENKTTLPSAALFIIRYHSFYRKYLYVYISYCYAD